MFYKIEIDTYPEGKDFKEGFGFYLVSNKQQQTVDLYYWNPNSQMFFVLEPADIMPRDFLKLFEVATVEEEKEEVLEQGQLSISEDFVLRLIAVSKVNTQSVKLTDILK